MKASKLIKKLQTFITEHGDLPAKVSIRGPEHDIEYVSLTGTFGKTNCTKDHYTLWLKNVSDPYIQNSNKNLRKRT